MFLSPLATHTVQEMTLTKTRRVERLGQQKKIPLKAADFNRIRQYSPLCPPLLIQFTFLNLDTIHPHFRPFSKLNLRFPLKKYIFSH